MPVYDEAINFTTRLKSPSFFLKAVRKFPTLIYTRVWEKQEGFEVNAILAIKGPDIKVRVI